MTIAPETLITVCDSCLCASCWQGHFYCQDYKKAGTTTKTVAELQRLNLESSDFWKEQIREERNR